MLKTRRGRAIFAGILSSFSFTLLFGILGYTIGFEDYGAGWTGFFIGVIVASSAMIGGALFFVAIGMVMNWIYKGSTNGH